MTSLDKFTRWYDPVTVKRGNLLISIVDPAVKQRSGERIFRNLRVIVNDLFRINSGAAVKHRSHIHVHPNNSKEFDYLRSVWCPHWPEEAHGLLNRPRNNGWPTTDIICEVLQNGCHVVWIQHRSSRNDDLQWRFSFSLAEVIFIQSWTQTQQIVYHLLRFFAKRELIQKDRPKEDEVLCTYHLKTLMLWSCESKKREWWNSACVITICSELLKQLSEWLRSRHCGNYFIPEANLFGDEPRPQILEKIVKQLNTFFNSEMLCDWFVEHYVLPFIRSNFRPTEQMEHRVYYMVFLFERWKVNYLNSLELLLCKTFVYLHQCISTIKIVLNSGIRRIFETAGTSRNVELKAIRKMKWLPIIQNVSCFMHHDKLIYILHIAYSLGCGEISWDGSLFVEFVNAISNQSKVIRSLYHNFPKISSTKSNRFQFLRAQDLLRNLTGSNCRSESKLLSLIAKQSLRKALQFDSTTCVSDGIVPASLAYLAALHFASSEYQEATRLCSAVLMDQTSNGHKETLNPGCLLYIDDVARVVGLCVLQKRITESNLHYIERQLCLDLRLSPKVFVRYLSVISTKRMPKQSGFYNNLHDSIFPMDINLMASRKVACMFPVWSGRHGIAARQIVYCRHDSITETEASSVHSMIVKQRVLDVLMEYASDNMTSFYNVIRKDFGVSCNTADCYRALCLYKCCEYDKVLHLCERILMEPDLKSEFKELAFANVLVIPPLDSFFDRDVQSLLGFHTLFYYLFPLNDDLVKLESIAELAFEHWFAKVVYHDKTPISIILQDNYSIKCQYFLGRHFLARYLKVRCCIDSNLPYTEALTEFTVNKTTFHLSTSFGDFFCGSFVFEKKTKWPTNYIESMTRFYLYVTIKLQLWKVSVYEVDTQKIRMMIRSKYKT